MAGKSKKRKIRLIAIAAALSTGGAVIGLLPTANAATPPSAGKADAAKCQQHKIQVTPDAGQPDEWSVYGDLYAGNGKNVHHWQEVDKPAGSDYVEWKFNYCGDDGWADVKVEANQHTFEKKDLKLDRDYCWTVEGHGNAGRESAELVDEDC
jgi:hypothetical protein